MLDQVFGVLFMLLLWALAIHYFRKHALARFVEWTSMWALDLDPEIKELIKKLGVFSKLSCYTRQA
jgi:hypothetical protein